MRLPVFKDKCRHFNGLQHKICAVGVSYDSLRDISNGPARWPCLELTGPAATHCEKRDLLTQEEHRRQAADIEAAVDRMLALNASGKCHVCGADMEPSRIVGRCKYAACGHRIGQVAREEDE